MTVLALVVAALLVGVVLVGVGDRLRLPWPVLLVLVGAGAAFVPGIDAPQFDPELILPLFLPPLLFATAQRASWTVFRERWRSVLFLAVLLVAVTIAAVGATVVWLVPGIAIGAAVASGVRRGDLQRLREPLRARDAEKGVSGWSCPTGSQLADVCTPLDLRERVMV